MYTTYILFKYNLFKLTSTFLIFGLTIIIYLFYYL